MSLKNSIEDLNQFVRDVLSSDARSSASPPVTLVELEDRYRIECDLPGVVLEQITVSVEDSVLSISGKRNVGELPESAKVIVNERPAKAFLRAVSVWRKTLT
jgi:HSP20 family molecular chaperone IbpA